MRLSESIPEVLILAFAGSVAVSGCMLVIGDNSKTHLNMETHTDGVEETAKTEENIK